VQRDRVTSRNRLDPYALTGARVASNFFAPKVSRGVPAGEGRPGEGRALEEVASF